MSSYAIHEDGISHAVATAFATPAHAVESFPSKPLRLIVPFAATGAIDFLARRLSIELSQGLGKQVVVENIPGATGNIGTAIVARAAPDGHTLLMDSGGPLAIAESLETSLPFDPARDFTEVAMIAIRIDG